MSERSKKKEMEPVEFYDALADEFDLMTGFEKRFEQERRWFKQIVDRYRIRTALDAGSGTGFHSILLAQLGVDVTAVDLSSKMLKRLQLHARRENLSVKIVESSFQELLKKIGTRFDGIFCMGNSLSHLVAESDIKASLKNFFELLDPSGILFVQILNYDRILQQKEKIQNIREADGTIFERSYEYTGSFIRFTITTKETIAGSTRIKTKMVHLRPLQSDEVSAFVRDAGFAKVSLFGGITLERYDTRQSKDIVVLAQK